MTTEQVAALCRSLRAAWAELDTWRTWHVKEGVNGCGHHPCHQYDLRKFTDLPDAAHGCVSCENATLRTQNQTQAESITYFQESEKSLKAQLAQVEQERERLLRGDFTDEELQGLCHNLDEKDRQAFFDGCTEYQERLFGTSAIAELTRSENSK